MSRNNSPQRRDERRKAARDRAEAWTALHWQTQLDRLHRRPGFSQAQRDRIMAPLTARKRAIVDERRAAEVQS